MKTKYYSCDMALTEEIDSRSRDLVSGFLLEAQRSMDDQGLNKAYLAKAMFMDRSHITNVFKGTRMPSIEFLVMLEITLGIKFKVYVPRETGTDIKIVSADPVKSLEVTLKSSWAEKSAYCKRHGISMTELDKKLKGQG